MLKHDFMTLESLLTKKLKVGKGSKEFNKGINCAKRIIREFYIKSQAFDKTPKTIVSKDVITFDGVDYYVTVEEKTPVAHNVGFRSNSLVSKLAHTIAIRYEVAKLVASIKVQERRKK